MLVREEITFAVCVDSSVLVSVAHFSIIRCTLMLCFDELKEKREKGCGIFYPANSFALKHAFQRLIEVLERVKFCKNCLLHFQEFQF